MNLREPCLPAGWYPREKGKVEEFLKPFAKNLGSNSSPGSNSADELASAVIAPHAGWYYSGSLAALAVSSLDPDAQTVVVIGGHLPRNMPILMAEEDGAKTPLGNMTIDKELQREFENQLFENQISFQSDRYNDNTVEVLLPMVHYFFPNAKLLWLRFPSELSSFDSGKLLSKAAVALRRHIVVVASADLTHYGDNYGFAPKGRGKAAMDWVKNVNDATLIEAVLAGDHAAVLKCAEEDRSSCSAGAILGALGFSAGAGKQAKLLGYNTSADVNGEEAPASLVGYAAISLG